MSFMERQAIAQATFLSAFTNSFYGLIIPISCKDNP